MVRKEKSPLSDLENKVMTIVWEHAEVTAEQVRSKIKLDAPPKESMIRTILSRIKAKGYVQHRTQGRAYLYSATEPSHNVAADAVRGIIDRICKGSVESLLVGMVNRAVVSPEKLRELADRIESSQKDVRTSKSPTKKKSARRKGSKS